jgi:hypothetical protein
LTSTRTPTDAHHDPSIQSPITQVGLDAEQLHLAAAIIVLRSNAQAIAAALVGLSHAQASDSLNHESTVARRCITPGARNGAMRYRAYSKGERACVFLSLAANRGNVKRTARETGVPESTVRLWRNERGLEPYPTGRELQSGHGGESRRA